MRYKWYIENHVNKKGLVLLSRFLLRKAALNKWYDNKGVQYLNETERGRERGDWQRDK